MRKKKRELTVTVSFVDRDGKHLGDNYEQILSSLSDEQRNQLKALILEVTIGKRHKPL